MNVWGVLAAAGAGERLGLADGIPKAMRRLGGAAMFVHPLRALDAVEQVQGVVLVVDELWIEHALSELVAETLRCKLELVPGGPTRRASIHEGLQAVPLDADTVVVHDAARPLVSPALIQRALDALSDADGAVCAVPLTDTIKRVEGRSVIATVPREGLWRAQTPQAFRAQSLRAAHAQAAADGTEATDDAMLVERIGGAVVVVDGDARNLKITTREDLAIAEQLLGAEPRP